MNDVTTTGLFLLLHEPGCQKVLPSDVLVLLVHNTVWADICPHGIEWATHTLLCNLYDLHMTRRAQCPQCCLSEMAGVAPSQQGCIQQVWFGPWILSEM